MIKHYGRLQIIQLLAMLAILVMLFCMCGALFTARVGEYTTARPGDTGGITFTKPQVEAEYLVVDLEDVPDSNMTYTTNTNYSYYVIPTTRTLVVKYFKTIQEVIEYLNDKHKDANYQPEVYQAIPVKMSVEVQESTNWHLQKDVQKTYRWKEK
jgi:hypothetical protein